MVDWTRGRDACLVTGPIAGVQHMIYTAFAPGLPVVDMLSFPHLFLLQSASSSHLKSAARPPQKFLLGWLILCVYRKLRDTLSVGSSNTLEEVCCNKAVGSSPWKDTSRSTTPPFTEASFIHYHCRIVGCSCMLSTICISSEIWSRISFWIPQTI